MEKTKPIEDLLMALSNNIKGIQRNRLLKALKYMGYTSEEKRSDLYFELLTCNRVEKEKMVGKIKYNYINFDKVDE